MLEFYKNIKFTIIFFLGTNCPITQNTTIEINRLFDKYTDTHLNDNSNQNKNKKEFEFKAVFPNLDDDTLLIKQFKTKYGIKFSCLIDTNQSLTNKFDMTTLPEVVVFYNDSNVVYKGKIDDLYFDIGKRRQNTYKRILDLKLDSIYNNLLPVEKYVRPLGCVIEKRK